MKLISIILFLSVLPFAARTQQSFDFSDTAIERRLRTDMYVLASDSMQGREAGTINEIKARNYVIKRFGEAGLMPVSSVGGYFQRFIFNDNNYSTEENTLAINEHEFDLWNEFFPLKMSANGSADGYLTDADYGLDSSSVHRSDDIKDVKGKIVIIRSDLPDTVEKSTEAPEYTLINRINELSGKGAIAVIVISEDNLFLTTDVKIAFSIPVIGIYHSVYDTLHLLKNSHALIRVRKSSDESAYNVIGCIDNGVKTSVVIGCHYDHLGIKKNFHTKEEEIFHGADDNASGTAAAIELARYLKQNGGKNNNYIICAFSAEEKGERGSECFVKIKFFDSLKVNYMFNFDMIGRLGAFGNVLYINGVASSKIWKKTIRKNKEKDFKIEKVPDGMDGSDHYPFYKKGIPILFFFTGLHKDYHTKADVASKINFAGEVSIIKYAELLINALDSKGKIEYRTITPRQTLKSYTIFGKMLLLNRTSTNGL
jgi:aminopeptidase YwaD